MMLRIILSRASCPRAVMTSPITFSPFQVSRSAAAKQPSTHKDAIKIKILQELYIFLKKIFFKFLSTFRERAGRRISIASDENNIADAGERLGSEGIVFPGYKSVAIFEIIYVRDRFFAQLCGIAEHILVYGIVQNGAFGGGDGYIVAVDLAVLVYGVAAYEGVIDIDAVEEVVGLRADDGAGGASYDAAADMNVKRSAAGEVICRLHRIGVNGCALHVIEQIAQCKYDGNAQPSFLV